MNTQEINSLLENIKGIDSREFLQNFIEGCQNPQKLESKKFKWLSHISAFNSDKDITYVGDTVNDIPHGQGFAVQDNVLFARGEFENGYLIKGVKLGVMSYDHRNVYFEGEFIEGKLNGQGKSYMSDNIWFTYGHHYTLEIYLFYEGQFKDDCRHGEGVTYHSNGDIGSKGRFEKDMMVDGETYLPNSHTLFTKGTRNQFGLHGENCSTYHENGTINEFGTFVNGKLHGYGKRYNMDGSCVTGQFNNGKLMEQDLGVCTEDN